MTVGRSFVRWGTALLVLGVLIGAPVQAQERVTLESLPLAAVRSDNTIVLYGMGQGEMTLPGGPWQYIGDLAWSPDGDTLVFANYGWPETLMVSSPAGSAPVVAVEETRTSGMPASVLPDGRVLYAQQTDEIMQTDALYGPVFELHAIDPQGGTPGTVIGTFIFAPGCGGGSMYPADWRYWDEAGFQGNDTILALTDYGIVHNGDCIGRGVALADVSSGEDEMLDADVYRAKVSPDGTQVLGIRGDGLALIDLATRTVTALPVDAFPDQVAWGAPGSDSVFYSVRGSTGNSLVDGDQQAALAAALGLAPDEVDLPIWYAALHRYDLASGVDEELFIGGYYAIGRMIATPDGEGLLFSLVPNMEEWATAVLDGTLDPAGGGSMPAGRELVQTLVMYMDLDMGAFYLLGEDLNQAALNTALTGG